MNILEMKGIDKSFVGVQVLKNVDLTIKQGEVHALLGENGAGKSTLMNILTGVYTPDAGSVIFNGKDITACSIAQSEEAGIAFVHQELNLFNDLKVYENIFFNKELVTKFGRLRKKEMIGKCKDVFTKLGVDIDPNASVEQLSASDKQTLEIAKAIFFEAKLLILDEPTTALGNEEIDHLFELVNNLKKEGKTFIFISHKMPEIFRLCDSYTVLRNGELIQAGRIADITPQEVTATMVGNSLSGTDDYTARKIGEPVLSFEAVSGPCFSDISLSIGRGEILGITGLQGSGTSEFLQSVFGQMKFEGGSWLVCGKKLPKNSIHHAMKNQIAFLPSNRKENSVIPDMTILENNYISEHELSKKRQHIHRNREKDRYEKLKEMLNIKAQNSSDPILSLSGGNQQKVFFARWLNTDAEILLLDNPTQGIDVGAKAEIYKLILEFARAGKTILVNSMEIPELQRISDRCAVFYSGRIVKILNHDEITEHTVMQYATNAIEIEEAN